ncbi:MAG: glycosyltransferase [Aquihabitans sp.]
MTVGTDHHPFDRLVGWVDRWAERNPAVEVLIQRGNSAEPTFATSIPLMGYDELVGAMAAADAVVAQGGPAGIVDARSVGHRPIVVARRPELHEHVDGHQVRFTRWMAERGTITLADDEAELGRLLDQAIRDPSTFRIELDHGDVAQTVAAFAAVVEPLIESHIARRRPR